MKADIQTLKMAIKHLPPVARKRAERDLGIAQPENEYRVFVYGTLLSNECNSGRARGARRIPSWTTGTIYDTGFGFPAFTKEGETRIEGELLIVNSETFSSMDRLEGYPRFYRREEINVFTAHGRSRAWVYIMNRLPAEAKVIQSGDWRKYRRGGQA